MKILLVEDNLVIQKIERALLEKTGQQVQIAENGQIAVNFLQGSQVDLILMDMQMPVMDGIEATKLLRSRGNRTPIIAITGHDTPEDRELCRLSGMNGFIAKPIKLDLLNQQITRIFG